MSGRIVVPQRRIARAKLTSNHNETLVSRLVSDSGRQGRTGDHKEPGPVRARGAR